jgi:hypothetical protein
LDQHFKNETVLINRPPEQMFLPTHDEDNFVKMPFVIEMARRALAYVPRKLTSEFLGPKTDGLVLNDDSALRQQIFDHAQTERK